jgi:hypothetical protein
MRVNYKLKTPNFQVTQKSICSEVAKNDRIRKVPNEKSIGDVVYWNPLKSTDSGGIKEYR